MTSNDSFFVLTGGPGSGKTTLIEALAAAGRRTMMEAGRAVIRDQVRIDGPALPWRDRALFAEAMIVHDLATYRRAETNASGVPVIFDRALPDCAGYLALCGLAVPAHLTRAVADLRYNPRVLLAPFWPEIFGTDEERRQDAAEAERTAAMMTQTYRAAGYEIVILPKASVAERVAFVQAMIAEA